MEMPVFWSGAKVSGEVTAYEPSLKHVIRWKRHCLRTPVGVTSVPVDTNASANGGTWANTRLNCLGKRWLRSGVLKFGVLESRE